jgi:hypothetical protein
MVDGFEAYYNPQSLHPCDLLGILIKESKLIGLVNNYPLRRTAVPYDAIELYAGNKRRLRLYVKDASLNPINLTGAVCTFTLKKIKSGPVVFSKRTNYPAEGMIGSADQGEAFFYVNPADTQSLDIAQYVYDVKVVLVGDDGPYTTNEGVINLKKPVG